MIYHPFKKYEHVKDSEIFKIEMKLPLILAKIRLAGVTVYKEELLGYKRECEFKITKLLEELYNSAGVEFDANSIKEVSAILKNKFSIELAKSDKFHNVLDAEVLKELNTPFTTLLSEYRDLSKQLSTYILNYQKQWVYHGNDEVKIHPDIWQIGTVTGRMSAKNPNIQNVPAPIKRFIGAGKNKKWLFLDYSQIQYRLFSHYTHDTSLIKGYWEGKDYHQQTADMLGIPRKQAKTINFGIIFGMGAKTLSTRLQIPETAAKNLLSKYHEKIPGLYTLKQKLELAIRKRGYITTAYGRRLKCSNAWSLVNYLIQGTEADYVKIALIKVHDFLLHYPEAKIIAVIHDEIIIEVPDKWNETMWLHDLKQLLFDDKSFSVPMLVDSAYTKQAWADKQEVQNVV